MDNEILEILKDMQKDIKELKVQVTENTQILKALEHSSEVNKAEHDKIINDVAKVQGDVTGIKKDLSRVEVATAIIG
ncbi:hypothetical protein psyc5s11_36340 [Clostridium gelidum]|uniref:Uncharacterized protein n=1 Tax=Clostridium gelidum TaxID=704125 RepID=A0ABN6J466_9CLOT|nr:hypothetical protein [Clostridium gelidum]BCZ47567.1 hypothetical protein psyc5s11_36340 [Clostridium gelidum]